MTVRTKNEVGVGKMVRPPGGPIAVGGQMARVSKLLPDPQLL